jgi:hypothetical protein
MVVMDSWLAASRRPGMTALIFDVVSTLTRNAGIEIDPFRIFFFDQPNFRPGRKPRWPRLLGNKDTVMPGLVPGIHVFDELRRRKTWMGRDKPGHDEKRRRGEAKRARHLSTNSVFAGPWRALRKRVFCYPRTLPKECIHDLLIICS